ncbi:DUF4190 domain-containing protein [Plantactinospora sonchi]|uniref:DUF4190 domain-containing protein n=1 Tax=Plantactinospora sonchi TaxID=1544735 RepID=A0ABU7RSB0_9ACTN
MNRDWEDLAGLDPWRVLGVPRDADPAQIRRAHRQRTRTTHTDVSGDLVGQVRLNLARDVLLDPVRRRDYEDRLRRADAPSGYVDSPPTAGSPGSDDPSYRDRFEWESGVGPSLDDLYGSGPKSPPAPEYEIFVEEPTRPTYQNHPPYPGTYPPPPRPVIRPLNAFALTSLILSVTGICCLPSLVAIPLAVIGLGQIRTRGERGAVLAWLALLISTVSLTLGVLYVVLVSTA